MNLNLGVRDIFQVLVARLVNAGLPVKPDDIDIPPECFDSNSPHGTLIQKACRQMIGHSWRHNCRAEPRVIIPLIMVVPVDLTTCFNFGSGRWQQEFTFAPGDISRHCYFLLNVEVAHEHNFNFPSIYRLNAMESVELLAESCNTDTSEQNPERLGLGSISTDAPRLPVNNEPGPLILHAHFNGYTSRSGIILRTPRIGLKGWFNEATHHLATAGSIYDPYRVREKALGTLTCISSPAMEPALV